ncbi:MAG: hypothetical protein RSB14_00320 [Kiritimatiellia bacterium]
MKQQFIYSLCACLGILLGGCATVTSTERSASAIAGKDVAAREATSPIAEWLTKAPECKPVLCSVKRDVSPAAVARFEEISAQVVDLYRTIHSDMKSSSTNGATSVSLDAVKARAREIIASDRSVKWSSAIQTALTANYKETLDSIEQERRALSDYSTTLRNDSAISNLTSRVTVLTQLGGDTLQISQQLKFAEEGASLLMRAQLARLLRSQEKYVDNNRDL